MVRKSYQVRAFWGLGHGTPRILGSWEDSQNLKYPTKINTIEEAYGSERGCGCRVKAHV